VRPGRADAVLAAASLLAVVGWVVTGFVDRDGDARLALSVALLALGVLLLVRLRRDASDRTWIGPLVFVLCGVAGIADRLGGGAAESVLAWVSFGVGVALVLRWRRALRDNSAPRL
jgi:hypothetical protein